MTTSLTNVQLDPGAWTDLCVLYPASAAADIVVRYLSPFAAQIVHGGASAPPSLDSGDMLKPGEAVYVNADHIWVCGRGALSITLL